MNPVHLFAWVAASIVAGVLAIFAAGIEASRARRAAQALCFVVFIVAQLALLTACGGGGTEEEEEPATPCAISPAPTQGKAAIPAKPCGKPTI